ncbi:MAG: hypothetical protein PHQ12_01375 [Chthoniobacteraceae bacterium]|nr:hypothetical protein [Chthoniobacteraceae bacterium]
MESYDPFYKDPQFLFLLFAGLCVAAALAFRGMVFFRQKCGLGRERAYLLSVGTVLAAAGVGFYRAIELHNVEHRPDQEALFIALCSGLGVLFGVPLAVKLYQAWMGGYCSEKERAPGAEGARAWLSPLHLFLAFAVSLCAMKGFGYPFLGTLALLILALLAYPVATLAMSQPSAVEPPTETLKEEREKVLSMLDAGKITAEESAELLNALGSTTAPRMPRSTPRQRLAWIGAGLVLIGFFLPWLRINPGEELHHLAGQMANQMGVLQQKMPGMPGMPQLPQGLEIQTPTVSVAGGDLPHGLGWLVLLLGIAAAALPVIASDMDLATRRMARMAALGAGSVVLVYLVTQNFRFLSVGIFIALAGYGLLWMSLWTASAGTAER